MTQEQHDELEIGPGRWHCQVDCTPDDLPSLSALGSNFAEDRSGPGRNSVLCGFDRFGSEEANLPCVTVQDCVDRYVEVLGQRSILERAARGSPVTCEHSTLECSLAGDHMFSRTNHCPSLTRESAAHWILARYWPTSIAVGFSCGRKALCRRANLGTSPSSSRWFYPPRRSAADDEFRLSGG